jgi:hypothetical protein
MRSRLTKVGVTIAALAALAVGGSALAGAAQNNAPAKAPAFSQGSEPAVPDSDNVQQGDQSAPDNPGEKASESGSESESASESGPSDGPGGYADSNPNADTHQQGEH